MKSLSNQVVEHLRRIPDWPDVAGSRYALIEELGRGGMGVVYLARDTELDREVALKVLSTGDLGGEARDRLLREARVLARLEHPGIVPIHEVGTLSDGRIFYAMKRVRGTRLDLHARTVGSIAELLRLFERICEPVAFAHVHGIIHRDLKPENIMVGPFGEVMVMDWGVAKIASNPGPFTLQGAILGTPGYMAPEQAEGEEIDERADVFSLGAILRVLLTGTVAEGVPKPVEAIYERAMAQNPADRYSSVADLVADVNRFLNGQRVGAHSESQLERLGRIASRHRTAIALIGAYLVVRFLVLAFGRA